MSQYNIIKMDSGGPIETQEQNRNAANVFETASGEYDAKLLAANFENNIDDYVDHIGMPKDSKDYQKFIDQAAKIQKGITDGTFRRIEGKRYEGTIISDGNKFQRLALGLLDAVIDKSNLKTNSSTTNTAADEPYSATGLRKFFYDYQFGGQEMPEFKSWAELDPKTKDGVRSSVNRANRFAEVLDKYADSINNSNIDWSKSPYGTRDEYQNRLHEAANALRNYGFDVNSKLYLNKIGISDKIQNELFGNGQTQNEEADTGEDKSTPMTHAAQLEALKRNLDSDLKNGIITKEEYDKAVKSFNDQYKKNTYGIDPNNGGSSVLTQEQKYQKYGNTHWKGNINKSSVDLYNLSFTSASDDRGTEKYKNWLNNKKQDAVKYQRDLIKSIYTGEFDGKNVKKPVDQSGLTNQQIIYNFFLSQRENQKLLSYASDGKRQFYLINSLNLKQGTVIRWNVDTNQFQRVYIQPNSDSYISKLFRKKFNEKYPETSNGSQGDVQWSKHGSKLKKLKQLRSLQNGGEAEGDTDDELDLSGLDSDLDSIGTVQVENIQNDIQQEQDDSIRQEAANKNIDPEIIKNQQVNVSDLDDDTSFQIAKWLRHASTATSAAGLFAMYVPEPTVSKIASMALFGISLGSDLAAEAIDYADGRTPGSDALINAIVAAATTIGPMKLAHQAKMGSALASRALKTTMLGTTGLGAYNTLATSDNAKNPFADDITVDELKNRQIWWSNLLGTIGGVSGTSGLFIDPIHGGTFRNNILGLVSDPITYALNWGNMPGNNSKWQYIRLKSDTYNPNETLKIPGRDPNQLVTITSEEAAKIKNAAVNQVKNSNGKVSAEQLNSEATSVLNDSRGNLSVDPKDIKAVLASEPENGDLKMFASGNNGKNVEITVPKEEAEWIRKTYDEKYKSFLGDGDQSDQAKANAEQAAFNEVISLFRAKINKDRHVDKVSPFSVSIGKRKWVPDWVSSIEGRVDNAFKDAIRSKSGPVESNGAFDKNTTTGRQNIENASDLVHSSRSKLRQWLTEQYLNKLTGERQEWRKYPSDREGRESRIIEPTRENIVRNEQQRGILDQNGQLTDNAIQELFGMDISELQLIQRNVGSAVGEQLEDKPLSYLYNRLRGDGFKGKITNKDVSQFYVDKILNDPNNKQFTNELFNIKNIDSEQIKSKYSNDDILDLFYDYSTDHKRFVTRRDLLLEDLIGGDQTASNTSNNTVSQESTASTPTPERNTNQGSTPEAAPSSSSNSGSETSTQAAGGNEPTTSTTASNTNNTSSLSDIQMEARDFLNKKYNGKHSEEIEKWVINNITSEQDLNQLKHRSWGKTKTKNFKKNSLGIKRLGGILSAMRYLRGGIIKAEDGGDTSNWDWYLNRFSQKEMLGTEKAKNNQLAGSSIVLNGHNQAFDLSLAAQKNQSYIESPEVVGQDIQNFYNNHGNSMNIQDFVNYYNSEMQKLRDTWGVASDGTLSTTSWRLNTPHGMRDHNRLFKELYASRSTDSEGPTYNIGYQTKGKNGEDIEDMVGSSSWMRRPDFYRVAFEQDTDDGKRSRIHEITLADGKKAKIYKKDNGDIAILPEVEQVQPSVVEAPQPVTVITSEEPDFDVEDGDIVGDSSGLNDYVNPKEKIAKSLKNVEKFLSDNKADFLALGRMLRALRTNKKVFNEFMKQRPALREPIIGHSYTRTGWSTQANMYNTASTNQNIAGVTASSDPNINNANRLQAAKDANEMKAKADLYSADVMYKTSKEQQNLDRDIYEKNVATQNFNNAALIDDVNRKHQQKASLYNVNHVSIDNELAAHEQRIRKKDTEKKENRKQAIENYKRLKQLQALQNDPVYIQLMTRLNKLTPGTKEWSETYNAVSTYKTQFLYDLSEVQAIEDLNKYGVDINDLGKNNQKDPFNPSILSERSGGIIDDTKVKRSRDDNQLLVKQILETIKTNEKALDRLSRSQLLSIRKILS